MLGKLRQAVSISEADVYVCACVGGGGVRPMCAGLV